MDPKESLQWERRRGQETSSDIHLIRLKEVLKICGKSRTSVYEAIRKGKFPGPLQGRSSAWVKSEVLQWVRECIESSRSKSAIR